MQDESGDQPATQNDPQEQNSQNPREAKQKKDDRMFYVMPNYLTVENQAHVPPISWKEKFAITAKGSFDPYEFAVVGVLSGIRHAQNSYPAFGQGMAGYGKRYGTAFADQVDGNIMVGAVFPTILKTDPRYFQLGKGGFVRRFGYAISRSAASSSREETPAAVCSTSPSLWGMPRLLRYPTSTTQPQIGVLRQD
jgi:hypothetical protein